MLTESVRIGCIFLACRDGLAKYQTCLIFHRHSLTLSVPWLSPPGNGPVVSLYGLMDTLPVLSYTENVLSGRTSQPVKYPNNTSQQAVYTNTFLSFNETLFIIFILHILHIN